MRISLSLVDYAVIGIYFVFVIGVGWSLKRSMKGSADFLMSGLTEWYKQNGTTTVLAQTGMIGFRVGHLG